MITLTATVAAEETAVEQGQVSFCDATAKYCTDIHLLGTTQLNSSGIAQMYLRPGAGSYSYKAIFLGTPNATVPYAGSTSSSSSLTVTGLAATATTITQSGVSGNYSLTSSVFGFAKSQTLAAPTGSVSFIDTTTNNSSLGMDSLTSVSGPGWVNVSNPTVGSLPGDLVAGDFNKDGNLDLAVGINTVSGSGSVGASILLGDGQGNFSPAPKSPVTGGVPMGVADFNQDGIPDLLLSNSPTGETITVFLGNGDGTFTMAPGSPIESNYGASPLFVADFNRDGIPDIATSGGYYSTIWLGNGDGSFTEVPPTLLSVSGPVGDFNNDGIPDLVTLTGSDISVFLGNGDGTFKSAINTPANLNSSPFSVVAADFNGDGKLDIAIALYYPPGNVLIFLGNGDGTFTPASGSPIQVGSWLNEITVGDFNGDGIADLLINAQTDLTDIFILLGNGDGTFTTADTGSLTLPCCFQTVIGDFNGDGVSDFASSSYYNGTADVFLTGAKQSSAAITGISVTGQSPQNVIASYPGDSNYSLSQSGPTTLLVQAASPVFAPASGGVIAVGQTITLTCSTPDVGIYYQAAGAISTNGIFVQYINPIQAYQPGAVTIQAYASSINYGQSATSTATYTVIASNPVPVLGLLSPAFAAAGSQAFTLAVNGSNFTSASVAYWGTTALNTQFVSTSQITAQVTSAESATAGVDSVSVQNPTPGGGTSNVLQFEVDSGGGTSPSFTTTSATVSAGSTATYPVTFSPSPTNVSVSCLNLPTGASCAYSAGSGTLTIATSNSTPLGTYQITAVFTETWPGTQALTLALLLLVPFGYIEKRSRTTWHVRFATLILVGSVALFASGCGGGSSQSSTHQATSSGVVTLTVQ
ncbi:MAG: FG-GAP repeat domain-containing protein [Terriglobales bacterium]